MGGIGSGPLEKTQCSATIEKARVMCGYIKDDMRIARYLGVCPEQVANIRASIPGNVGFERRLSQYTPNKHAGLGIEEYTRRKIVARQASNRFLRALRSAGA